MAVDIRQLLAAGVYFEEVGIGRKVPALRCQGCNHEVAFQCGDIDTLRDSRGRIFPLIPKFGEALHPVIVTSRFSFLVRLGVVVYMHRRQIMLGFEYHKVGSITRVII